MDEIDCYSYMFSQLHDFMRQGLFTDVIFVVGTSTFKAHKVVLASCSSVFQTLFATSVDAASPSPRIKCCYKKATHSKIDNFNNVIIIKDIDEESFIAFLDYLYCRDIKIVETRAENMMRLAYKYQILDLLPICDSFIEAGLNNENAVQCLLLADHCKRVNLKEIIKSHIKNNLENIMGSETWHLLDTKFDLTTEIIEWDCNRYHKIRNHMDEVTWKLSSDSWKDEAKEEIIETRGVMIISPIMCEEPKVDIFLSFFCRDKSMVIVGYSDYCFRKPIPLTFIATVTDLNSSRIIMEKKVHLTWCPAETDGTEIMTLSETADYCFTYPLNLNVSVRKTPVVSQHPSLRGFNFYEIHKKYTDVQISVKKSKHYLHKLVLASKSPYFSKMFEHNLEDYNLTDIDECSFKCLVNYMYSCIFPPPEAVDLPLLEGARRYQLNELSEYCVTTLIINLGVQNVLDTCIQADVMGFDQLKLAAVEFIAKHRDKVIKSINWRTMKDHPHLLKEILAKISHKERAELELV
ncbi:hypothetical protein GE061_004142 [Apolygus lucorum]|uniref:BTB domain-containing protein n=1 Tax=Apolygus lucorum TaxID=248454 RepID=A0A8S9WYF6_APOLU|nr:hypothetical protein GE061_004142 [Apolygus lucorum]